MVLGSDSRARHTAGLMIHETSHLFGLPDLYNGPGVALRELDVMAAIDGGPHMTVWNRARLGWISADQLHCQSTKSSTIVLTPAALARGIKGVVVPVGSGIAYVIEAREAVQDDVDLCDEGLLMYKVATAFGSLEPMSGASWPFNEYRVCAAGSGRLITGSPTPHDIDDEIRVELLEKSLGSFRVKVTRRGKR